MFDFKATDKMILDGETVRGLPLPNGNHTWATSRDSPIRCVHDAVSEVYRKKISALEDEIAQTMLLRDLATRRLGEIVRHQDLPPIQADPEDEFIIPRTVNTKHATKLRSVLRFLGVVTVRELASISDEDLISLRGVGRTSVRALRETKRYNGV
jgi:hypothetical protein